MIKRIFLSVLTILYGLNIQAQQLTEQEALQKAEGFLGGKTFSTVSRSRGSFGNFQPYYVFNAQEGGFVIVSGDERAMPVLGYSDNGNLDMDNLSEGAKDLLNRYAEQVRYLQDNNLTVSDSHRSLTRGGEKAPLIQTQWNQQSPYWDLCPLQDGVNCYTGCTATAMAQMMYYWAVTKGKNTPAKTTKASESYTPHVAGSMEGAAFSAGTSINWSQMTTTYNSSSSADAKTAVAQLMSYCGTAVKMAYNKKGSYGSEGLMSIVPYALKEYFGYPNTVTFEAKESYLWKDWVEMIMAELDADRPVMYSATSTGAGEGGHAFIIDGYDNDGNFHINWGYSGKNDGYFALNVMQYSDKYRYNLPDNMITGFCPDEIAGKEVPPLRLTATNFGLDETADGELCLNCNFYNYTGQTISDFQFGYGYIDNSTGKIVKLYNYIDNFIPEKCYLKAKGKVKSKAIKEMVKDLEITSCKFFPICKLKSETEWRLCNNGDNSVYLKWRIQGESFSIISRKFAPSHGLIMTPPAAKTDLVYTGSAQDLIVPGIMLEGDMYYWLEGESNHDNTAIPQGTDAGEYTVYYYDEAGEYASITVTIAPQPISSPTISLSQTSYTYDGNAKEPTVEVKNGSTTFLSTDYVVSYSNNINVGTATVTISPKEGSNYAINGSATFSIIAADGSVTPPTGKSGLVYTGAAQNLITEGSSTTGTIQYSLDGTNYSTSIPQGTDAKEYTVYYKVVAKEGYNDVDPASFKVTIAPKTVSSPTITLSQTSYEYDGTAKEPTVTVKDGETTISAEEYSVSYSNNTNAGTATVTITDKEGGNYIVSGSTTFEIKTAEGSVTAPTAKTDLIYNGGKQDLITAGSSTTGTIQYSLDGTTYDTAIPQGTDAKEYTVYYKVVAKAGYKDVDPASFKVTIAPKTVSVPTITLSATSFEYDGTAKEPMVTVKDGETIISAGEYSVSYSNNTNAGTATVTITDKEGGNYIVSGSTTFEIKATDDPSIDDPSIDDPSIDDPSIDDPSIDDPSTDDPSTDDPSTDDPSTEDVAVTISGAKQVPYCSDKNLNFSNKPELKAYVATGYDKAKGTIWLTRVKQVPANTGFLLMGEAGDYDIPTIDGVSDVYYKNMFKGTISGETIFTTDGDYTNYYLSKGSQGVGFYKVTKAEGQSIGANRCYLPILTEIPVNGSEGDAEVIKVSAAKQVPYFTSKNLDFSTMEAQGVKAYTATGYNYKTGTIWLTRVKKVPAHTGVLVMASTSGEFSVPTASVASVYENMFAGSETAQTIYTNETVDGIDYVNYYLSNGEAGVGFYKVTKEDGQSLGANRCYLRIPKRDSASGARGMSANTSSSFSRMILLDNDDDVIAIPVYGSIDGDDDDTTNIQSSIFNVQSDDVYYNLQGQRVENPGRGIYIRNGVKVVIR